MTVTALTKLEWLVELSGCTVQKCMKPMYRVRNTFIAFFYFFTIICFVLTVVLILRAKKRHYTLRRGDKFRDRPSTDTSKNNSAKKKIRSKISGNALANPEDPKSNQPIRSCSQYKSKEGSFRFPMIKLALNVASLAIFNFPEAIWSIWLVVAPTCFFQQHWNPMMTTLGFIEFFLLLRIFFDSLMAFALDRELRRCLCLLFSRKSNSTRPRGMTISSGMTVSSLDAKTVNTISRASSQIKEAK
ncbi:DihydroCaffeic Acid Receptor [Ditylenchus destructor]|nr:DihydroCaffeic Acid Receptor [Ditylenchus destructor]